MDRLYCSKCNTEVNAEMNFCPKCGSPFKTTNNPTPIYILPDPPPPLRTAPLPLYTASAVLWAFSGFFFCLQNIDLNHLPIMPSAAIFLVGIVIGIYFTNKIALRELRNLDKNQTKFSRKKIIAILTAVIAGGIILLLYIPWPSFPSLWYLPITIIYPLPATICVTRAIVYFTWQKRMDRKLYLENNKLISVPNQKP